MQTAAAYIRVSTEDQLEFSPDSQLRMIRSYAISHQILLPEHYIYLDEGISGRYAKKRPAFMQMIQTARTKPRPFDLVLVWKFSRFARNRQDSILYKSMLRRECGIDVISITEQLSDDPTSILIEAMLEAMDEYYSINLAQEVRRGMDEKFSRGGVVSIPPFGYRMGTEHFEITEPQAAYVRKMYAWLVEGLSCRRIAGRLNDLGVRTNRGNAFDGRSVEYILTNPVYTGRLRRSCAAQITGHSSDIQVVMGHHRPIISEDQFNTVQNILAQRKHLHASGHITTSTSYMLQGLVRCSSCGGSLARIHHGKALQCSRYARGRCKTSHYITLKKLNQLVLSQLERDILIGQLHSPVANLPNHLQVSEVSEEDKNHFLQSFIRSIEFCRQTESVRIQYYSLYQGFPHLIS